MTDDFSACGLITCWPVQDPFERVVTSSGRLYIPGTAPHPLHNETRSDDNPYAERSGNEYIAFAGWGDEQYDLYVFRRSAQIAVKITNSITVFGPILFD